MQTRSTVWLTTVPGQAARTPIEPEVAEGDHLVRRARSAPRDAQLRSGCRNATSGRPMTPSPHIAMPDGREASEVAD